MQRPNLVNSPSFFYAPGTTVFTNTIVDAIDTAANTDKDMFPYCHTATVPSDYAERNYVVEDSTTTLNTLMRIAFGVFISANNTLGSGSLIYQCSGALTVCGDVSGLMVYPVFGRLGTGTVVSATNAPNNELATFKVLPFFRYADAAASSMSSFQQDVLKIVDTSNTYPYFCGWVMENLAGGAPNLQALKASIAVRSYTAPLDVFRPDR